jgi:PII-like signaling protein
MVERLLGIAAPAKLLIAVFDAQDEWHGEPLQEAIVRVLEAEEIAGITVLEGITGFGAYCAVRRRGLIGLPHDKPTVILEVETEAKLRAVLPTLRPMIVQGIVVLSDAEVIPLLVDDPGMGSLT